MFVLTFGNYLTHNTTTTTTIVTLKKHSWAKILGFSGALRLNARRYTYLLQTDVGANLMTSYKSRRSNT